MNVNENIEIKISNDGPPFEVNDPMELFDSYKKDKEGKFGLGLAIVKQVINAHEGTILAYNSKKVLNLKFTFETIQKYTLVNSKQQGYLPQYY